MLDYSEFVPDGLVHPRYGIAREILRFPTPQGFPDFVQIALPLAANPNAGERTGEEPVAYGSAFETELTRSLTIACGEAVERYAGGIYSQEEIIVAKGLTAPESSKLVKQMVGYSDETLSNPDCPFGRYNPSSTLEWVVGESESTGSQVLLPAECVIFGWRPSARKRMFIGTSSGLAAGASMSSAKLSALLEIVERDAFSCTWLLKRSPAQLKLEPAHFIDDPKIGELLSHPGVQTDAFLLSPEHGVPVVLASLRGRKSGMMAVGASARLGPYVALRKAILEAVHSFTFVQEQMAKGIAPPEEDAVESFLEHALFYGDPSNVHNADFLFQSETDSVDMADFRHDYERKFGVWNSVPESLEYLVYSLGEQGFDPIIFDRTPVDVASLGYSVVRAVVPGLQPIWTGNRWVPDDNRRLATFAAEFSEECTPSVNTAIHPFP